MEFKFHVLAASLTQSSRTSRENGDVLVQMSHLTYQWLKNLMPGFQRKFIWIWDRKLPSGEGQHEE